MPELPLDAHHGLERPLERAHAVHHGRGSAARIVFCDATAERAGIRIGQSLAGARARLESLHSVPFDDDRIARAQRDVVSRLLAVSPRIAPGGIRRFFVEPVGSDEALAAWCRSVAAQLAPRRPLALGLGPSATVAYAAARSVGHGARIVPPRDAMRFLDERPIDVLDVPSEAIDILHALGIRTVRQLRALDPVSLGMRFGPAVAEARRRADGIDPRGPAHPREEPAHAVEVELPATTDSVDTLVFLLRSAVDRWLSAMRAQGLGATELRLDLALDRDETGRKDVRSIPLRTASPWVDGRVLVESLRTQLERLSLPRPVVRFALVAEVVTELRDRTLPLLPEGRGRDEGARDVALDRVRARLGDAAVRRASHVEASSPLARASFVDHIAPLPGDAMPFRRIEPPAPVTGGRIHLRGRTRLVLRTSLVERSSIPWWHEGEAHVELFAHAEVEGPMLVLLRGRVGTDCDDRWEAVAYLD